MKPFDVACTVMNCQKCKEQLKETPMKLLTLEEIEKIGSERYPARHGISGDDLEALLATARAYWELKHQVSISSKEGMRKKLFNDSVLPLYEKPARLPELADDKPHARTIRAIVEALEASKEIHTERSHVSLDLNRGIKSLEKHLE